MTITAERPTTTAAPTAAPPALVLSLPIPAPTTYALVVLGGAKERIEWTATDVESLALARERFDLYKSYGYLAYTVDGEQSEVIRDFVPEANMTMHSQMQGG